MNAVLAVGLDKILAIGVVTGLLFGLIGSLFFGLKRSTLTERLRPNEGIHRSARSAALIGLVGGVGIGIIGGLVFGFIFGPFGGLLAGLISGLFFGLVGGLLYGGEAVINHYLLRLFLWFTGTLPWDITTLLDAGVERILLQRVGGRWRFVHRLLQEHLAANAPSTK